MSEKTDKYTAELARHLRFRGVDEKQVQEAVWSVESHTADSGTSPQQAFGAPGSTPGPSLLRPPQALATRPCTWWAG